MPYCENCGNPVNESAKFCRNCGAPQNLQSQPKTAAVPQAAPLPVQQAVHAPVFTVQPQPQAPQIPQAQPQEAQEQIQSFIIVNRSKRFVNLEYLTGILTNRRMIFAPMTKDMIKEVTNITRQQAKDKTGPINAYPYQQNYFAIPPQVIINQSPGGTALENVSIRQIKLELVSTGGDGYADNIEFEMKIFADSGTYTFRMTKRDEYVTRLNQLYHDKLELPKNYFPK
jgi:hypothetical protein